MLDVFIIEEIKRREREREEERPRIELPLPEPRPHRHDDRRERDDKPERGVIIIDYSVPVASL